MKNAILVTVMFLVCLNAIFSQEEDGGSERFVVEIAPLVADKESLSRVGLTEAISSKLLEEFTNTTTHMVKGLSSQNQSDLILKTEIAIEGELASFNLTYIRPDGKVLLKTSFTESVSFEREKQIFDVAKGYVKDGVLFFIEDSSQNIGENENMRLIQNFSSLGAKWAAENVLTALSGTIIVNAPVSANLFINGKDMGRLGKGGTLAVRYPKGTREISVIRKLFPDFVKKIEIESGEEYTLSVDTWKVSKISVSTDPTNATVFVDNEEVGISPVNVYLQEGKHRVRVVHQSGEEITGIFSKENETSPLYIEIGNKYKALFIPEGARVGIVVLGYDDLDTHSTAMSVILMNEKIDCVPITPNSMLPPQIVSYISSKRQYSMPQHLIKIEDIEPNKPSVLTNIDTALTRYLYNRDALKKLNLDYLMFLFPASIRNRRNVNYAILSVNLMNNYVSQYRFFSYEEKVRARMLRQGIKANNASTKETVLQLSFYEYIVKNYYAREKIRESKDI